MLFDYLREIQAYRENKYTKFTLQKELRAALITVLWDQGDPLDEAQATAGIYLRQAIEDETHMEDLVETLNRKTKKKVLGEVDQVKELNIYVFKMAT